MTVTSRAGGNTLTLFQAAESTGGRVVGSGNAAFRRVSPVHDAGPEDLALLTDRRYATELPNCGARALLVSEDLSMLEGGPVDRLVVADPHEALVTLLAILHPAPTQRWDIHPSAAIDGTATLAGRISVGPNVVIGAGATIGSDARIGANCVIGERVEVGAGTVLFPNVTLYPGCVLGQRVIVHAGTRIGVDGFGYVQQDGKHAKVPQVGGCVIEDDVEIGANCAIDRGSIGCTRIGAGSKLDNLVHLGHNVVIGRNSLVVAQVGVAGSTRTGDGVALGGQAGLVGHLKIGAGAKIGAQAGVISDVAPGQVVSGYPARDHRSYLKAMARLMRLPDVVKRIERIERHLDESAAASSPGDESS
ncbi:MAG: UDP-3-O-(3-hydroxymyristoyl)glucosamine N-acyltransferase [Gemmatimonadetes bacterium]|nr:UDP-3-O-(3-hydroxymyristoyl)glucosamine N-acyltransferase [Gemmatimonadota bacterium]MYG37365.1 UDP-3-O-(3-hydroxymyristoyl)glucosamine N-acyltransferase [Gemmatimonadota bacterium]